MTYTSGWQIGHAAGLAARLEGPAAYAVARQAATAKAVDSAADSFEMGFSHGLTAGAQEAEQQAEFAARERVSLLTEARQVEAQRLAALQDSIRAWGSTSPVTAAAREAHTAAVLVTSLVKRNAAPALIAEAVSRRAAKIAESDKLTVSGPPKNRQPSPFPTAEVNVAPVQAGRDEAAARHFQSNNPGLPVRDGRTVVRV